LDKKKLITKVLTELIKRSGEIAFTVFVIIQAVKGSVSLGSVALYIGFAVSAAATFENGMYRAVSLYFIGIKGLGRLFNFLAIPADNGSVICRPLNDFESLTFDNVYFKYPMTDKYVLKGASFTLNKGDKLSIIGVNGSGKTTIVKLMLGLYPVESGQILINGYPMSDYDIRDVRKLFSVLFQNFVQYPLTLRDNIALSDLSRRNKDEEIIEALKKSGAYEYINKFEKGLDSYMTRQFDDKGVEVSKGQWQRIALSRAYFKDEPIIIFDEPSAALDAEAEDKIFKNFEAISENKTGIMISHRISRARMSNKIIVLDNGQIVESGVHDELVRLNGLYARLYNLQMGKYALQEAK